jgi:hypothetical protein
VLLLRTAALTCITNTCPAGSEEWGGFCFKKVWASAADTSMQTPAWHTYRLHAGRACCAIINHTGICPWELQCVEMDATRPVRTATATCQRNRTGCDANEEKCVLFFLFLPLSSPSPPPFSHSSHTCKANRLSLF